MPTIHTAAILVIGDEVLNGKIKDTNSHYFSDFCFKNGIDLRRICVVPDEVTDIVSELNVLRSKYDFIVTTGGIGPTHDDITYESIAEAYGLPLQLHKETVQRMDRLARNPPRNKVEGSEELKAQLRMATFPSGPDVECNFVAEDLWVPVVSVKRQVYIFPGIPSLFTKMLECLLPQIAERFPAARQCRHFVSTTSSESVLAPILNAIQVKYRTQHVKIGSYPHICDNRNTVSILGPIECDHVLLEIVQDLVSRVADAREITAEEEALSS